jgi:transglutaminase-like putative cysteine protease
VSRPAPPQTLTGERTGDPDLLVAIEVALGFVTLAAVVGMHRLFLDGTYWWPLALQVVVAHLVVAALRRAGVGLAASAVVAAGVAVVFIAWTRFPETTWWLLPTGDTLAQVGEDMRRAWSIFGEVRAPAPVENGFIAATAAAIWVVAYIADWAAFRVGVTLEAVLPATTLFVFAAALGGPGSPVASAALFAGAVLMYALLHRTATQERTSRWAGGRRVHGRSSLVGTGATLIVLAVAAGAVAGPNMPGADEDALLAWRDINQGDPTRVVLSPIVELQTRLVQQPDIEVFTVRSNRPSYWRLTALDDFDGEIWKSSYQTGDVDGDLSREIEPAAEADAVTQEVEILALDSVWMPAAFEPTRIEAAGVPTDYDPESSTLLVDEDNETDSSDGYSYTVTSQLADFSDEELRAASPDIPDGIRTRYTALPGDFPDSVEQLAEEITADETTAFDKAHALQDFLRSNAFTYDTDVGPGHSQDALVSFLLDTRRGYCEQFAGSFAAMARHVGLPARVAVGFTWGITYPEDPTLYRVRGRHAHAWPEVYIGEYGWVPFEPTPGRGMPRSDYLDIRPGQDTTSGGAADPEAAAGDDQRGDETGEVTSTDDRPQIDPNALAGLAPEGDGPGGRDTARLPAPIRESARPAAIGLLAYVIVVPLAIAAQQVVRRRRAAAPKPRARYLWRLVGERSEAAGVRLHPYMTLAERADALAEVMPAQAPAIQELARTLEAVNYGDLEPTPEQIERAERAADEIVAEANRRRAWWQRALSYLDARRLRADRTERIVAHHGVDADVPVPV